MDDDGERMMVKDCLRGLIAAGVLTLAGAAGAQAGGEDRPVRGWLEHARIETTGLRLDAKLDSGAKTSSINAEILRGPEAFEAAADEETLFDEEIEEVGEADETGPDGNSAPVRVEEEVDEDTANTIIFRISNDEGESSTLSREVIRYVEIKNRDGTSQRRPVVELTVCLAGVWVTGEVNLADRSDFNYPFLIGRNMLEASGILVDAREIYTRRARCSGVAP